MIFKCPWPSFCRYSTLFCNHEAAMRLGQDWHHAKLQRWTCLICPGDQPKLLSSWQFCDHQSLCPQFVESALYLLVCLSEESWLLQVAILQSLGKNPAWGRSWFCAYRSQTAKETSSSVILYFHGPTPSLNSKNSSKCSPSPHTHLPTDLAKSLFCRTTLTP